MDPRPSSPRSPAANGQSGQAIVEAAFMLPMMIFFILCTLQLTLLQQARIMVEYAAFNAARTGVVHNMDNGSDGSDPTPGATMRNAAAYSILPTFGRTDSMGALTTTLAKFEVENLAMRAVGLPLIKVTVLNPHKPDFALYGTQLNGQELDFDDMRPQVAAATLLSIQVRYMFELRVPFANKMIESIWMAAHAGILATWTGPNMLTPGLASTTRGDAVEGGIVAGAGLGTLNDGMEGGLNVGRLAATAAVGRFYLPLDAWYSMRMQSNPYVKWASP